VADEHATARREELERLFPVDVCDRLTRSEHDYYSTHGAYVPPLALLLNETRAERDALAAREQTQRQALERIGDYGCGCAGCQIARETLRLAADAPAPEDTP